MSNKYRNRRVEVCGRVFASQLEADRYLVLLDRQERGEISDLQCQVPFVLQDAFKYRGEKVRAIRYFADFTYREPGNPSLVVEDSKGRPTPVFKLKAKMLKHRYPELDFRVVRKTDMFA